MRIEFVAQGIMFGLGVGALVYGWVTNEGISLLSGGALVGTAVWDYAALRRVTAPPATYFPDDRIERRQIEHFVAARDRHDKRNRKISKWEWRMLQVYTIKWKWRGYQRHLHFSLSRPRIKFHRGLCVCEIVRMLRYVHPDKDLP